ncbi:MAG: BTAD domain-containing putative transcriptional regulator [Microthrixaceae bacterium]
MAQGCVGELTARLAAPRIAVLGPVAVGPPMALRSVSGHPARVLLALAGARRPCRLEVLAEAVWGTEPPATHRAAMHVHLGTVRRVLDALGGNSTIVRSEDGYRLDPGDCEIDATLAVDLLDAARSALQTDPLSALFLAEAALGLWRGVPFAVDGEVVDASASQWLDAVRRDGDELLVEALLQSGDAIRAERAAQVSVDAEPLREHRWGQLLRARYLGGRTADALATFQVARRTLVDQLGIEPGVELQELEAAALTHDRGRLQLPPARGRSRRPPPAVGQLIGRDAEIGRVETAVAEFGGVVLVGPPGVGKSRLAVELVGQWETGGVAWIDVRESNPTAVLDEITNWARGQPDGLVVFDGADSATANTADALSALRRRAPTIRLVVTSRVLLDVALPLEIMRSLPVPGADATDAEIEASPAVVVLRAAMRDLGAEIELPTAEAALVARRASGLPLALRLSAAAARALSPSTLAHLPPSIAGDEIDLAIHTLLGLVDAKAATAFADLSIMDGEFDTDIGAMVAGLPLNEFATAVVSLVDHGLVEARLDRLRPYVMLEPIRAVGERVLDERDGRAPANDRLVDACIAQAKSLQHAADVDPTGLEVRFGVDLPRHRAALRHLARVGDAERALTLVCRLEAPLYALGWWAEKVELFDLALAIPGPPSPMRARAHAFRARPGPMHTMDDAHAERAEAMAAELGQPLLRAFAWYIQAIHAWWAGRPGEAAVLLQDATLVFERAGRTMEACEARKFHGVALVLAGEPATGLEMQREALDTVRRELGAPFHVAHNLAYLGHCHRLLGDDDAARADWTEARELCGRVGNRGTAIHISIGLAEIAVDGLETELALLHTGEALTLLSAGRAWTYEPWAWTASMRAHASMGDLGSALACARRAAAGLAGVPPGESVRLAAELAGVALQAGEVVPAARLLGVACATDDIRELPFPSPCERHRFAEHERQVAKLLGADAEGHIDAGRRCTLAEAAGRLLAP